MLQKKTNSGKKGKQIKKLEYTDDLFKNDYQSLKSIIFDAICCYIVLLLLWMYYKFNFLLYLSLFLLCWIIFYIYLAQKTYSPIIIYLNGILWKHSFFNYLIPGKSRFTHFSIIDMIKINYYIDENLFDFLIKNKIYPLNEKELSKIKENDKVKIEYKNDFLKDIIILCDVEIFLSKKKLKIFNQTSKRIIQIITEYIKSHHTSIKIIEDNHKINEQFKEFVIRRYSK